MKHINLNFASTHRVKTVVAEVVITVFRQTLDHFNCSSKFRLQGVFVLFLRHAEPQQGWHGVLTSSTRISESWCRKRQLPPHLSPGSVHFNRFLSSYILVIIPCRFSADRFYSLTIMSPSVADLIATHHKVHIRRGNNCFISPMCVSIMQQRDNLDSGRGWAISAWCTNRSRKCSFYLAKSRQTVATRSKRIPTYPTIHSQVVFKPRWCMGNVVRQVRLLF